MLRFGRRHDIDERLLKYPSVVLAELFLLEVHLAVFQGKNCVVLAKPYVFSGMPACAALADDYVAGLYDLTPINLNPKPFGL